MFDSGPSMWTSRRSAAFLIWTPATVVIALPSPLHAQPVRRERLDEHRGYQSLGRARGLDAPTADQVFVGDLRNGPAVGVGPPVRVDRQPGRADADLGDAQHADECGLAGLGLVLQDAVRHVRRGRAQADLRG